MARTQNVKRNLIFNIIKYIAQILLRFILRTVLIYTMGAEYIGLNGLFGNIFNFLNLAELGVGSAIVFAMYKPIAENDLEKVRALQNLYKKFYYILALVISVIGVILTPFVKIFINGDVNVDVNIYILFLMYLFNAVIVYFSAHKRSLLLAYQRNDIENKISTICLFLLTILQIGALLLFKNFYIYFAVESFTTVVECIVVTIVANKYFPQANGKSNALDSDTKKSITKNVVALSMHKVGSAVVFATDNILISAIFGLTLLGAYANYAFITNSLATFFTLITTALTGSVGNLIASSTVDYSYQKFKQINFIYSIITAFCTICLLVLIQPFIKKWTGGGEYLLDYSTVILICISFYLTRMGSGVSIFKDCAGLYWQDKWKPIVESVVNLGVSIGLAYLTGINGIFLGTIVSTLVAPFWVGPYIVHKYYFKRGLKRYFARYALDVVITLAIGTICYFVCGFIPDGSIWLLIAKFAACIVLSGGLLMLAYCWTPEFKETIVLAKQLLHRNQKKPD